ncbi:hypothetical protein NA56DRAFT_563501 [Hyaloscypha hepaticicola]|uniref:F-box domain-containing protein n=1 Tax=Hyaloscypha hepaticicola TaxID=2082293 RepID=A0A2J6QIK5_9HELO|nr:hypothetical protein NA56DRAFT_563501 [Hyaloscypha hepaticicola]
MKPDEIPPWDRNITTQGERYRKRFKMTRASMDEDIDVESITKLAQNLQGETLYSWGIPKDGPILALQKKKTQSRITKKTPEEEAKMRMIEDMRPKRGPIIPNSPERSPILRIPLKIREKIFSYLLVHKKPIMVKEDWTTVERNPFLQSHAIVQTCKQFAEEASQYIYKANTFQALLRNPATIFRRREDPVEIHPKYCSLFRNIIINCSVHCWDTEWFEKVTAGLQKIITAKADIQSLAFIFDSPKRVGMTTTALGMEYNAITFADFLWYDGAIMEAVRNIHPKTLNIVVKKSGGKRFLMSVDMTCHQSSFEETPLADTETIRLAKAKADMVKEELLGLKDRFEEISEDDEWALQCGKCRLLEDGERVSGTR